MGEEVRVKRMTKLLNKLQISRPLRRLLFIKALCPEICVEKPQCLELISAIFPPSFVVKGDSIKSDMP